MRKRVMKIQRMFSNVEGKKLYSTGNDELDDLLEKAFCEGYEYAQKEFGRTGKTKEQNKQFFTKEVNRKARRAENRRRAIEEGFKPENTYFAPDILGKTFDEEREQLKSDRTRRGNVYNVEKDLERASKNTKTKKSTLGKIWNTVESTGTKEQLENENSSRNILRAGRNSTKDKYSHKSMDNLNGRINRGEAGTRLADRMDYKTREEYLKKKADLGKEKVKEELHKTKKLSKGGKAALIGVPIAAAAIGTGVAIKKHKNKKKKEDK